MRRAIARPSAIRSLDMRLEEGASVLKILHPYAIAKVPLPVLPKEKD